MTKVQLHVMLIVGTMQCEAGTIKCEEKKKNKGTIEYYKSTITCDVGTM